MDRGRYGVDGFDAERCCMSATKGVLRKFTSRSAVRSFDRSAPHPDLRICQFPSDIGRDPGPAHGPPAPSDLNLAMAFSMSDGNGTALGVLP